MGELIIYHKGERLVYLINTEVKDHVMQKAIDDILKWFPSDSLIEFNDYETQEN